MLTTPIYKNTLLLAWLSIYISELSSLLPPYWRLTVIYLMYRSLKRPVVIYILLLLLNMLLVSNIFVIFNYKMCRSVIDFFRLGAQQMYLLTNIFIGHQKKIGDQMFKRHSDKIAQSWKEIIAVSHVRIFTFNIYYFNIISSLKTVEIKNTSTGLDLVKKHNQY